MHSAKDTNKIGRVLSVSELTAQIRDTLEFNFDQITVVGEISNAKVYPSGHWYFSLKDKDATLPCVCFKNSTARIKFELEDGLQVVARGKLSVYPPRGAYQMVATHLEPVGIGEWQLAFEQLKAKLEAEGLLAMERKRPIPTVPHKIGVVTSIAGAALHDILTALNRRNRNVRVVVRPAKVQGEGSAEDVAQAIADLQTIPDIEVILVARGGGSIEDLWSFNTEVVARAVAACRVPVVSGVGHETDITICDLVADLRAPTPTAGAELVAKGSVELISRWSNLQRSMLSRMEQLLSETRWKMRRLDPMNSLLRYQERLKTTRGLVNHSQEKMIRMMLNKLAVSKHRLDNLRSQLVALGPDNVLSRGFSILQSLDGRVIRDAREVQPGDFLEAHLYRGKLRLRVELCESAPDDDLLPKTEEVEIGNLNHPPHVPQQQVPQKVSLELEDLNHQPVDTLEQQLATSDLQDPNHQPVDTLEQQLATSDLQDPNHQPVGIPEQQLAAASDPQDLNHQPIGIPEQQLAATSEPQDPNQQAVSGIPEQQQALDDASYDEAVRSIFQSDIADIDVIAGQVAEARMVLEPTSSVIFGGNIKPSDVAGTSSAAEKTSRASSTSANRSKSKPRKASDDADPATKQLRLTL
jgi:exodeoxyribonuclease VII large subunit